MGKKSTVIVEAPGKINLSLDITGVRPDGYHDINTIMQSIDLCDTITITRMHTQGIYISCDSFRIPSDESNLAHIAAARFFEAFEIREYSIAIDIQKRIPIQAGLAGGSADAAAVLIGLNTMFDVGASPEELSEIGRTVGSDVPFCLRGGTLQVQGVGEVFTELPAMPDCEIVLAKPATGISTSKSYALYDQYGTARRPDMDYIIRQLRKGNLREMASNMYNVLQEVAQVEEIPKICSKMIECGSVGAIMSGSGSAVLGLFENRRLAKRCSRKLFDLTQSIFLVRPVHSGAYISDMIPRIPNKEKTVRV